MSVTNLREKRIAMNLTQEELSSKIGIKKQSLSNIETGKRKPSYEVIVKLQKIFNKTIDYLLQQANDNSQQNNTTKTTK